MNAFNDSIMIQMFPEVAEALEDQISEAHQIEKIKSGMHRHHVINESGK